MTPRLGREFGGDCKLLDDFGFRVNDRFLSTALGAENSGEIGTVFLSATKVQVYTSSSQHILGDNPLFFPIVY